MKLSRYKKPQSSVGFTSYNTLMGDTGTLMMTRRALHYFPGHLIFVAIYLMSKPAPGLAFHVPASPSLLQQSRRLRDCSGIIATSMQSTQRGAKQNIMLLAAKAKKDPGTNFDDQQRSTILEYVKQLETANTCRNPAENPLLSGKWSLLVTLGTKEEERAQKEGIVGSAVTELSGASGQRKRGLLGDILGFVSYGNYQDILLEEGKVFNRAALGILGQRLDINIEGACTRFNEDAYKRTRIAVAFQKVNITLGKLPSLSIPLGWVNGGKGPQGWVETTYLDQDLRVGRGDKGSIFVAVRRPE